MEYVGSLFYVCPLLFLAGIIDGAVGGGGIIAFPAYIMTGMPIHFAYGCNKLQSFSGTLGALVKYRKNKLVDVHTAVISALAAVVGSLASTRLVLMLDDRVIRIVVFVLIPMVPIMLIFKQRINSGNVKKVKKNAHSMAVSIILGLAIGFYDGLFGPGSGTMSMILFAIFLNCDLRVGCGNGKVVVAASNLMALANYIISGKVIYVIAIPAAIFNTIGCAVGAELAIRFGKKIIMPFAALVLIFLFVQNLVKLIY